mgnify:CR=1 FL=1
MYSPSIAERQRERERERERESPISVRGNAVEAESIEYRICLSFVICMKTVLFFRQSIIYLQWHLVCFIFVMLI